MAPSTAPAYLRVGSDAMRYDSTDWSLERPEGWACEQSDCSSTFCHPQGTSAFQVSSYREDEAVALMIGSLTPKYAGRLSAMIA